MIIITAELENVIKIDHPTSWICGLNYQKNKCNFFACYGVSRRKCLSHSVLRW